MPILILLLLGMLNTATAAEPQFAVVIVPVADVWSEPSIDPAKLPDIQRETQVLNGEQVLIHESSGPWVQIEAMEQPAFTHHQRWEGYPGWVLKKYLGPLPLHSLKSASRDTPEDILQFAKEAIGTPYLWGGLSQAGFDCSGLVHLAYRKHVMKIPRDSYEQWMKAKPIKRNQLMPADLIFSAKAASPKKITHVALYAGDGQIIEAPQTGMAVRRISFKEKYGAALDEVESGNLVGERILYFGTFLHKEHPADNRGG